MANKEETNVLITGGHMTPAMAVLTELKQDSRFNIMWAGIKYEKTGSRKLSPEYQSVSGVGGVKFINFKPGKLVRSWDKGDFGPFILNLIRIPFSFLQSIYLVMRYQPDIVVSFGGYIALPIALTAKFLGHKVVTHEQTITTGLANKIIAKYADKIMISWPSSAKHYPDSKTVLTGNPVRNAVFEDKEFDMKLDSKYPTVYITGGHQGASVLNQTVTSVLKELLDICNVIHQTGAEWEALNEVKELDLGKRRHGRYYYQEYFYEDQIGSVFAQSDLVISRAGANTVYDILLLSKPTIFVPIPWVTQNEQLKNAKAAASTGIATIIEEKNLTGDKLLETIKSALENLDQERALDGQPLKDAQSKARNLVPNDGTDRVVNVIKSLLDD